MHAPTPLQNPIDGVDPFVEDYDEAFDLVEFRFQNDLDRRTFLGVLGAGLMLVVASSSSEAQPPRRGGRGGGMGRGAANIAARLHIGKDGTISVLTGKVECGQGARAELTQAAAEELRTSPDRIKLVMADTGMVPDDGGTFGSRSTPATVPAIRQACAAARDLLTSFAAKTLGAKPDEITIKDGIAWKPDANESVGYPDLAADPDVVKAFASALPATIPLTKVADWNVLGKPLGRPNGQGIVTGSHDYPSDIARPGMLFGKVLRGPTLLAKLVSIDLAPARGLDGVIVVQDNGFTGFVAPTTYLANAALEAASKTAVWDNPQQTSSSNLFEHLKEHARGGAPTNPFANDEMKGGQKLAASYHVAYVQHCPMEPRTAVAEWQDGKLTVWTASQQPFGVKGELVRAFGLSEDKVRVIIPDFGGGFGGKHSGECAVEAARLAKAAGKPVRLQWTRPEEFTWAQFRPAAVIEAEAALDAAGKIASWHFININSGQAALQTPYAIPKTNCRYVDSSPPLRHGSYRGLAATANTFAREGLMDELAALAGQDPLAFRLVHLEAGRLRDALEAAAHKFDWQSRTERKQKGIGVGLACGIDKGSFVAACVEVSVDLESGEIDVLKVCQAYDCGKILNPANLLNQVQGAIVMGLGPALREEVLFENGKVQTTSFTKYQPPRFADLPEIDVQLLDRPDMPSAGAGETPLIAVAPAIANAVFQATGQRVREMPIRLRRA